MNLQASELLKIAIIMYIPFIIDRKMPRVKRFYFNICTCGISFILFSACLLQRDVGQTLLIIIIFGSILLYSGLGFEKFFKGKFFIILTAIAAAFFIVLLIVALSGHLPGYLQARFSTLVDPFASSAGTGYHISNSLIAIGNGGLFGRGLGNSVMKLGYLPEPHTDFIFAIICEELGLVGGLFVIGLLFLLSIELLYLQIKRHHISINLYVLV